MTAPPDSEGRRPRTGNGALDIAHHDVSRMPRTGDHRQVLVTAIAVAGRPVAGRRSWLVLVLQCPVCREVHAHRAFDAARLFGGEAVRRCPATRARYVLDVTGDARAVAS